jgi:acid phosphatase (class A)
MGRAASLPAIIFPSDIEAGRLAATAIAVAFMQNEAFMKDFTEAKAEIRRELGLPIQ